MILLDTNILIRFANDSDPQKPLVTNALDHLRTTGASLVVVPQNLYEFWVAATRPQSANGLGFSTVEVGGLLSSFQTEWTLLPDPPVLFREWESLVTSFQIQGKPAHDARLVAAMSRTASPRS